MSSKYSNNLYLTLITHFVLFPIQGSGAPGLRPPADLEDQFMAAGRQQQWRTWPRPWVPVGWFPEGPERTQKAHTVLQTGTTQGTSGTRSSQTCSWIRKRIQSVGFITVYIIYKVRSCSQQEQNELERHWSLCCVCFGLILERALVEMQIWKCLILSCVQLLSHMYGSQEEQGIY